MKGITIILIALTLFSFISSTCTTISPPSSDECYTKELDDQEKQEVRYKDHVFDPDTCCYAKEKGKYMGFDFDQEVCAPVDKKKVNEFTDVVKEVAKEKGIENFEIEITCP